MFVLAFLETFIIYLSFSCVCVNTIHLTVFCWQRLILHWYVTLMSGIWGGKCNIVWNYRTLSPLWLRFLFYGILFACGHLSAKCIQNPWDIHEDEYIDFFMNLKFWQLYMYFTFIISVLCKILYNRTGLHLFWMLLFWCDYLIFDVVAQCIFKLSIMLHHGSPRKVNTIICSFNIVSKWTQEIEWLYNVSIHQCHLRMKM